MSGYIGTTPVPQASQTRDVFTATAGQTTFATSGYTVGFLDVYVNGSHLKNTTDYTATNGSDVVMASGLTAGDYVEVVAFNTFSTSDTVSASSGGTFSGDVSFGDNVKAEFGASSDLQIYHNGSDSWVEDNGTGNLYIDTNGAGVNITYNNSAENMASFTANGAAALYYDSSKKFETSSVGSKTDQLFGISDSDTGIALGANGANIMQFYTGNNERMKISSEGYITKNNHPVFRIECASVGNVNASSGRIISGSDYQSNTLVQNGSHFNVSTGRFTAPVNGYYYFNFSNRLDNFGGSYIYFTMYDNGGNVVTRNLTSLGATYQTLHCSAVHYMSANDYVYVQLNVTGDTDINMDSDGFFSGFLIG